MKQVIGIVDLYGESDTFSPLTAMQTLASVPFGGRYRLIDFALSSMVHSGIDHVSVMLQEYDRSLLNHLGRGQEWGLDRKRNGLFILPPPCTKTRETTLGGNVRYFQANKEYFAGTRAEYVLIAPGHLVGNIDFRHLMMTHTATKADVTLLYQNMNPAGAHAFELVFAADGTIKAIERSQTHADQQNISLETVLLRKELFLELLESAVARGDRHFIQETIMGNADCLTIHGCETLDDCGLVNTPTSYYKHSMKLLNDQRRKVLFGTIGRPILTNIKDESPTRYGRDGQITNSMIAAGCSIEGTVQNSILFHGVHVDKGAVIHNSILLPNCHIAPYAELDQVMLDKTTATCIGFGQKIKGAEFTRFESIL